MSGWYQVLRPPTKGNSINRVDKVVICFQFKKKPYGEVMVSVSVVFDPQKMDLGWGGVNEFSCVLVKTFRNFLYHTLYHTF